MVFDGAKSEQSQATGIGSSGFAKETSTANFTADVISASRDATVIVDFYSSASPQCRQQSEHLAAAVQPHADTIRLVRLNIDKHPAIAGQLRLQSVPTVFVFREGRPVDGFSGIQPPEALKQFVANLVGADVGAGLAQYLEAATQMLEAGELQSAAEQFAAVLQQDSQNVVALSGLAQCYLKSGDTERARQTIELVPPEHKGSAAVQSVLAALDLSEKVGDDVDIKALEAKVTSDPTDHQARFDLAIVLGAAGQKSAAVDHLMQIVSDDRQWNDEAARKQLIQFFDVWGFNDKASIDGRRRLSSLLFS